eukprot:2009133-Prymnesium_polylepis.1
MSLRGHMLRRTRKPPDKSGRRRDPKPSHPRGPYRGTTTRRPRHAKRGRGGDQPSPPARPHDSCLAQQACRLSACLVSWAHLLISAVCFTAQPFLWLAPSRVRVWTGEMVELALSTAASLGLSDEWTLMIALSARIATRAAWHAASIPCTACVNGGQAAVSFLLGWSASCGPPSHALSIVCTSSICAFRARVVGRRLRAWDPSCASRPGAALEAVAKPNSGTLPIPDRGTHVGLRDIGTTC